MTTSSSEETLLRRSGHLLPAQARTFVCLPFAVPPGAQTLRVRFSFDPPQAHSYRNLLTLSLYDPGGFRGAAHRHAPQQDVVIDARGATPGFVPGALPAGKWLLEIACHCVLESGAGGVDYELEVASLAEALEPDGEALPGRRQPLAGAAYPVARAEGTEPHRLMPEWEPRPAGASASGNGAPDGIAPGGRYEPASVNSPGDERYVAPSGRGAAGEGPRWLKGDLHVHSNHSDGRWTVEDLVAYAREHRLDFLALTDHNTISGAAAMERAARAAGLDLVLIPAMELTTFHGHANALGVAEWIDWRVRGPEGKPQTIGDGADAPATRTMERAAAEVHRLGGTFVINHPRSPGYPACTGCRWEFGNDSAAYADALEVWNGGWGWGRRPQNKEGLALWNRWLNAGRRLAAVAGSDGHVVPTDTRDLGFTYVWSAPHVGAILEAVRAGHSYLSAGPRLAWCRPAMGEGVPADAGELVVEAGGLAQPADLRLAGGGKTLVRRTIQAEGPVLLTLPRLEAPWYRAELYRPGTGDLLAMTNPLYRD